MIPSAPHVSLHAPKFPHSRSHICEQGLVHDHSQSTVYLLLGSSTRVSASTIQHSKVPFMIPSAPHFALHGPRFPHSSHTFTGHFLKHVSSQSTVCLLLGISTRVSSLTIQHSLVPGLMPSAPHDSLHGPKFPHSSSHTSTHVMLHGSVHSTVFLEFSLSTPSESLTSQHSLVASLDPGTSHWKASHSPNSPHSPHSSW